MTHVISSTNSLFVYHFLINKFICHYVRSDVFSFHIITPNIGLLKPLIPWISSYVESTVDGKQNNKTSQFELVKV